MIIVPPGKKSDQSDVSVNLLLQYRPFQLTLTFQRQTFAAFGVRLLRLSEKNIVFIVETKQGSARRHFDPPNGND